MDDQLIDACLDDIEPDPEQPRKDFDPVKLQELADSICAYGVLQPIIIKPNPNPNGRKYLLIAGERRWRASYLANKKTIPAVLKQKFFLDPHNNDTKKNRKIKAVQLGENLNRVDLNPVERAEFINEYIELARQETDAPLQLVAQELGVSVSWISKNTAILKYSEEVRRLARKGMLRDYTLLRKVEKLKPEKKSEAIQLIESGSFNSKEFFSRKRPIRDEKKSNSTDTNVKFKLSFNKQEIINFICKTDFCHVLNNNDPDWKNSDNLDNYIKQFGKWSKEAVQ